MLDMWNGRQVKCTLLAEMDLTDLHIHDTTETKFIDLGSKIMYGQ